MQKLIVIAGIAVLAAGCSSSAESEVEKQQPTSITATTTSRLIGGAADTGDPAVVVFQVTGGGGGECTAVFVSTTVLLTAAHCVLTESGQPLTNAGFRISHTNDIAQANESDWIAIDPTNVHPHPSFTGDAHDVAVLVLSKPAQVTPFALIKQPLAASDVGKSVRIIGYGASVAGASSANDGFGVKRHLTTTIASVDANFVQVGKSGQTACSGDSGGPALLSINGVETIIGLDSYSDAEPDCSAGEFYQRVDAETAFIAPFLSASPPSRNTPGDDTSPSPSSESDESASPDEQSSSKKDPKKKSAATTDTAAAGCTMHNGNASHDALLWPAAIAWAAAVAFGRRRRRIEITARKNDLHVERGGVVERV